MKGPQAKGTGETKQTAHTRHLKVHFSTLQASLLHPPEACCGKIAWAAQRGVGCGSALLTGLVVCRWGRGLRHLLKSQQDKETQTPPMTTEEAMPGIMLAYVSQGNCTNCQHTLASPERASQLVKSLIGLDICEGVSCLSWCRRAPSTVGSSIP